MFGWGFDVRSPATPTSLSSLLLCLQVYMQEVLCRRPVASNSSYLDGVMMCLMHQDELFAPR